MVKKGKGNQAPNPSADEPLGYVTKPTLTATDNLGPYFEGTAPEKERPWIDETLNETAEDAASRRRTNALFDARAALTASRSTTGAPFALTSSQETTLGKRGDFAEDLIALARFILDGTDVYNDEPVGLVSGSGWIDEAGA